MAYQFTGDTGRTFTFATESAYEAAEDWYNFTSKADIIAYCGHHGVDLRAGAGKLIPDWADIAIELWARHELPSGRRAFRACYWLSENGQGEVRLTSEEQAGLSDDELRAAAMVEAKNTGLDLSGGSLVISEWRE